MKLEIPKILENASVIQIAFPDGNDLRRAKVWCQTQNMTLSDGYLTQNLEHVDVGFNLPGNLSYLEDLSEGSNETATAKAEKLSHGDLHVLLMENGVDESIIEIVRTTKSISSKMFLGTAITIWQQVSGFPVVISRKDADIVRAEYIKSISKLWRLNGPVDSLVGPKPTAMTRDNAVTEDVYLKYGYAITDKADGLRMQLYITGGFVYLIDSNLVVMPTGINITKSMDGTILDGEFIEETKKMTTSLFAVFDAYTFGKQSIVDEPFTKSKNCRHSYMLQAVKRIGSTEYLTIEAKQFYFDIPFRSAISSAVFGARNKRYETDGWIFQPRASVFANLDTGKVSVSPSFVWYAVMKLKLPKNITIDLLLKRDSEKPIVMDGPDGISRKYVPFKMYAAGIDHIATLDGNIAISKLLGGKDTDTSEVSEGSYTFVPFRETDLCMLPMNSDGEIKLGNHYVDDTSTVVEVLYRPNEDGKPVDKPWCYIPERVRTDKTKRLRDTGRSKGTANDITVVMSTVELAEFPITMHDLVNGIQVDEDKIPDVVDASSDVYYNAKRQRDSSPMFSMLNLHNLTIGPIMWGYAHRMCGNKNPSILELACGKGGDLFRAARIGCSGLLGLDLSIPNIENGADGAISRYIKGVSTGRFKFPASFSVWNFSDNIKKSSDPIIQHVVGTKKNSELSNVPSFGQSGFDIISCQFAMHYAFENATSLAGFVKNIGENLTDNGVCILTTFNKKRVMKTIGENRVAERRYNNRLVWAVSKMDETDSIYGNTIDVYLERTGQTIREYLVDFDELRSVVKKNKLEIREHVSFEKFQRSRFYDGIDVKLRDILTGLSGMYDIIAITRKSNVPGESLWKDGKTLSRMRTERTERSVSKSR